MPSSPTVSRSSTAYPNKNTPACRIGWPGRRGPVSEQAQSLSRRLRELRAEQKDIEKDLQRAPDDEVLAPLRADIADSEAALEAAKQRRAELAERLGALRFQLEDKERQLKRAAEELERRASRRAADEAGGAQQASPSGLRGRAHPSRAGRVGGGAARGLQQGQPQRTPPDRGTHRPRTTSTSSCEEPTAARWTWAISRPGSANSTSWRCSGRCAG